MEKDVAVAKFLGNSPNNVHQPFCRRNLAFEAGRAGTDDIREHEGFNFAEVATDGELGGHLAAAVAAVGVAPFLHGFFAIDEGDPNVVAIVLGAKESRKFEHYAS